MIRDPIIELVYADPFEPSEIKLVNGDHHKVFDPQTVSVERTTIFIASIDGNWLLFPIDKINSVGSQIADFHGELAYFSPNE